MTSHHSQAIGQKRRLTWGILLTVGLYATFGAMAQEAQPAAAPVPSSPDLSSPRAALATFLDAMNEVRAGEKESIQAALACIHLDTEAMSEQERLEQGPAIAQRLFEVLDSTTIDIDAVPETFEDDNYKVHLGHDEAVTLHRYRDEGNVWRFSYTNTVKVLDRLHQAALARAEEDAPETTQVNPKLASPRATMKTFIEGINRWNEGGKADAVSALDLSEIDPTIQDSEGEKLAAMLKDILDRHEKVIYQKLPNVPEDVEPYVYLSHDQGTITIVPTTNEESGAREWKFSAATLAGLEKLRDAFKDKERVVAPPEAGPVVLSLVVRDWVGTQFPFLGGRTFLLEDWQWVGMFLVILAGFAVGRFAGWVLLHGIRKGFARKDVEVDLNVEKDFIRPIRIAIMAWVWWLGLNPLGLPANTLAILLGAAKTITAGAAVWAVYRLVDLLGSYLTGRAALTDTKFDDLLVPLVTRTLKVFTVVLGLVFIAESLALPIKSLLAGLGLGGLAFALAAKDTVSNVFGSLTVLLDRPFQIGDWVVVGDAEGTVEGVGIRSTRIRTFYNSLITVPNSALITAKIDNLGARRYRRIKTMLSVAYDTPPEKIDAFCAGIRQLIREHPYTRKDYFHVWLNEFGGASLNILLYCFHETPDWSTELRERHRLFLDIIRLAKRLGVEFAFPTQTLFLRQDQMPTHEAMPAPEAWKRGAQDATAIVDEFQGGRHAPPPPPVAFDVPEQPPAPSPEDLRERGGEDLDSE